MGAVNLAAGREAVLTFDSHGLLGVRITEAVLQEDLGVDPAVLNTGGIYAAGGQILLTASVSEDIFSQAVNAGDLRDALEAELHEDGSFTLGVGIGSGINQVATRDQTIRHFNYGDGTWQRAEREFGLCLCRPNA